MAFVSIMLQDNAVQPMQQVLLDKHFKRKHGPNAWLWTVDPASRIKDGYYDTR